MMNEYQNVPDNTRNYPNGRGKKLLVSKGDEEDERGKNKDRIFGRVSKYLAIISLFVHVLWKM